MNEEIIKMDGDEEIINARKKIKSAKKKLHAAEKFLGNIRNKNNSDLEDAIKKDDSDAFLLAWKTRMIIIFGRGPVYSLYDYTDSLVNWIVKYKARNVYRSLGLCPRPECGDKSLLDFVPERILESVLREEWEWFNE